MFSYRELAKRFSLTLKFPKLSLEIKDVSIDTRTLTEGELFIALEGSAHDGHDYIEPAYQKGASGVVARETQREALRPQIAKLPGKVRNLITVPQPLEFLTNLASAYRKTLPTKIVAITGSVGKTITKEFLYFLLGQAYPTFATSGNFNNHLGVPLTLCGIKKNHQFCVVEMGANHPGEISHLSKLSNPDAALLTPIGPSHLEGFGSLEKIYDAKLELVDVLGNQKPLVIPSGDEFLQKKIGKYRKNFITVGETKDSEYRISNVSQEKGRIQFKINDKGPFAFPGNASFLALNAGLAIAMARTLGVPWQKIPQVWDEVSYPTGRFREILVRDGIVVIDDSYNANPLSFKNALRIFSSLKIQGKKILIFSDMLELGAESLKYHKELGEKIASSPVFYALAYGEQAKASIEAIQKANTACMAKHFEGAEELVLFLGSILRKGDTLLLKGSRGMHVEKVLAGLKQKSVKI